MPTLTRWAKAKGPEGLDTYRRKKNVRSLDGLPTGLLDEEAEARLQDLDSE